MLLWDLWEAFHGMPPMPGKPAGAKKIWLKTKRAASERLRLHSRLRSGMPPKKMGGFQKGSKSFAVMHRVWQQPIVLRCFALLSFSVQGSYTKPGDRPQIDVSALQLPRLQAEKANSIRA